MRKEDLKVKEQEIHNMLGSLLVRKIVNLTYINLTTENVFLPYDDSDYILLPPCGVAISSSTNDKDMALLLLIKQHYPGCVLIGDKNMATSYPDMIVAANLSLIYWSKKIHSK